MTTPPTNPPPAAPDNPADAATVAQLAAIPGLDSQYGLEAMRGRLSSYLRLLDSFVQSHGDDPARIAAQIAQGHLPEALRLSHSLKGAAGSLGVVGLQSLAAKLEAALRTGQAAADIQACLDELSQANHALIPKLIALPRADSVSNRKTKS